VVPNKIKGNCLLALSEDTDTLIHKVFIHARRGGMVLQNGSDGDRCLASHTNNDLTRSRSLHSLRVCRCLLVW